MHIQPHRIYVFTKSGNRFRAVAPTQYGGHYHWRVVRMDGSSIGKGMIVPACALASDTAAQA